MCTCPFTTVARFLNSHNCNQELNRISRPVGPRGLSNGSSLFQKHAFSPNIVVFESDASVTLLHDLLNDSRAQTSPTWNRVLYLLWRQLKKTTRFQPLPHMICERDFMESERPPATTDTSRKRLPASSNSRIPKYGDLSYRKVFFAKNDVLAKIASSGLISSSKPSNVSEIVRIYFYDNK